jgi:hypothetical protein
MQCLREKKEEKASQTQMFLFIDKEGEEEKLIERDQQKEKLFSWAKFFHAITYK